MKSFILYTVQELDRFNILKRPTLGKHSLITPYIMQRKLCTPLRNDSLIVRKEVGHKSPLYGKCGRDTSVKGHATSRKKVIFRNRRITLNLI